MKKEGFTLIELLFVIALISIITTALTLGMRDMLNRQEKRNYNEYKKNLETAACTYAEVTNLRSNPCSSNPNGCFITKDNLINMGYLDKDEKVYKGFKELNNVVIKWDSNGLKTCKAGE